MSRVFLNLFCYPGVDPELPYRPLHESKMLASDIMLSYHYHLHAGGEHYNSIVPAFAFAVGTVALSLPLPPQDWAVGGADATRRLGSALGEASVPHLHVGWGMALHCLGTALLRRLVRTFVLR